MLIDLHIHSRDCSDGRAALPEIFEEARHRKVNLLSVTDHDSIDCQVKARELAARHAIRYLSGVELNISFAHPAYRRGKPVSLDLLGYQFDPQNRALDVKLRELRDYRRVRAQKILQKINLEIGKQGLPLMTDKDLEAIQETVNGAFGRPHIADYMVRKGLVGNRQEAFDKYLVKCNVPKMPVSLEEAAGLVRGAGGKVVLAHPADPNGTSLVSLTASVDEQLQIIEAEMLPFLDGLECWHSRHSKATAAAYLDFARRHAMLATGGSDCHQQPVVLGTVPVPDWVAGQFGIEM